MAFSGAVFAKHSKGLIAIDRGALGLCFNVLDRMGRFDLVRSLKRTFEEVHINRPDDAGEINVYSNTQHHLIALNELLIMEAVAAFKEAHKFEIAEAVKQACVNILPIEQSETF
mgnify:CR=1 FL=1